MTGQSTSNYPSPTVACFDATRGDLPRRQLDIEKNNRFLESLSAAGAPSLLIGASTGHGHLRNVEELDEWFRSTKDARIGETKKIALLRPEDGPKDNRRLVQTVAESGYSIVFVRPGTDLPSDASDKQVAHNLEPLLELICDAGLLAGVYSISDVSGIALKPDAVAPLLERFGDRLIAVKVTEADYDQSTRRYLDDSRIASLKIVQGWDPHLGRALQDAPDRCGVTSGAMSFSLFQYRHILSAAENGDWEEVASAQSAVTNLFESMQDVPGKFADLQRAKYIMGLGHPVAGEVTPAQVDRVFAALKNLNRQADRSRLAKSLNLMGNGPFADQLAELS